MYQKFDIALKDIIIPSCVHTSIGIEGETLSPLRPLCKGTSPLDPIIIQHLTFG